jgi:hypothetical protein
MNLITPDLSTTFRAGGPGKRPYPDLGATQLAGNVDGGGPRRSLVLIVHRGMVVAEHVRLERSICVGPARAAEHPGQRRPRELKKWAGLSQR